MLTLTKILVEHLDGTCVTDQERPRFTVQVTSDQDNNRPTEVYLRVGSWTLKTPQMVAIEYAGPRLEPFTIYTVEATVTDVYGQTASSETTFETGRLGSPWAARWITDGEYRFVGRKTSPIPLTFEGSWSPRGPILRARLYATAWGIYEVSLNGAKIGDRYFAPGFTSYRHHLAYQTYDVTALLRHENRFQFVVAGGWAVGAFTYARRTKVFAKRQALLAELRIEYDDGTVETWGSSDDWKVTQQGPLRAAEFYDGEVFDARVDDDSLSWHPASVEKPRLKPTLIADYGAPVRAHEELEPVSVVSSPSGEVIYDFGQNLAGVIAFTLRGNPGQVVTFRHAEVVMDGELFTQPLRTAKQTLVYTCREGNQSYSPTLTSMGFRYVGVRGIAPENLELNVRALYSEVPSVGSFACSHELLNKLQNNIRWGAKSNFVDIPTDCPQRDERMGWTGDIALFGRTAAFNFDTSRFLEKWLEDVRVEQNPGGGIPVTVPLVRVPNQGEIVFPMAVDHWGDACVLVPWAEYLARGDLSLLKRYYPTMQRYLKACVFWAELFSWGKQRRVWKLLHHYGDWVAPGVGLWAWMGRGKWTATASLANTSRLVATIARLLGHPDDARRYEKLHEETADAYRSVLMQKDGRVKNEFQTAYVLPLHYNMLGDQDAPAVAAHLVRLVRSADHHIGTGFPGTPYILFALADNGYPDDAMKMLLQETCPSWLFQIKAGGTTPWERWDALREDGTSNTGAEDGTNGMVSFNHYAVGAVGDFLYRRIAGLEALEGGYRQFLVKPLLVPDLSWAEAGVDSPYGPIRVRWDRDGSALCLRITVPFGCEAVIELPGLERQTRGSGTWTLNTSALGVLP